MFAIRNADGMGKRKKKTSWSDINKRWSERPWLITSNIPTFNFIQIKRCCVSPDVCLTENHLIPLVREEKNKYKKRVLHLQSWIVCLGRKKGFDASTYDRTGMWAETCERPRWHRFSSFLGLGLFLKPEGKRKFPYMECVSASVAHCEVSPDNVVVIITQRRRRERKRRWRTVFHQRSKTSIKNMFYISCFIPNVNHFKPLF